MIGREDELRGFRDRLWIFQLAAIVGFSILVMRLFYLQVFKGEELRNYSEANRLKKEKLIASRGIIYDRNGKVIVDNRASFDVVLLAQYYTFTPENNARLAKALQMDKQELEKRLAKVAKNPTYAPILLKADVSKDVIAAIETDAMGFAGVDVEPNVQRRYPFGDLESQLLGYISEVDQKDIITDTTKKLQPGDYKGRMGIERLYDSDLRGDDGVGYVEVDARGRRRKTEGAEKVLGFFSQTEPTAGSNLYLTIDVDLAKAANDAMKSRHFDGAVVALDPRTGEVLAMVSRPAYDPGLLSGREIDSKVWTELVTNKERPLRNRAIQDIYMPGSTFKAIMAIAALSEGVVKTGTTHFCPGYLQFGNRRPACWKTHGTTDIIKAIRESCNVFFYQAGNQLGVDTIAKYSKMFGLGEATGVVPRGEQRGLIPTTEWKQKLYKDEWHPGETLSVSIGQGYVSLTPMQLVAAYAAIANGGFLYKPYLVRRVESMDGQMIKEFRPELKNKAEIKKEVLDMVKQGLFEVVNAQGGTAIVSGRSKKTIISGKTGTAQVRGFSDIMSKKCESLPFHDRHHGFFVGYAPRENPEIAVVALAERGCHGATAAPIVREVIEAYIDKQNLERGVEIPVAEGDKGRTKLSSEEMDE